MWQDGDVVIIIVSLFGVANQIPFFVFIFVLTCIPIVIFMLSIVFVWRHISPFSVQSMHERGRVS